MNQFGTLFRITIFGESHGNMVGVLVDGCPPGIPLTEEDLITDLGRRKSGAKGTTPRVESDIPTIQSGVLNHTTTGAPILIEVENTNVRSKDYSGLKEIPRPGHADFVSMKKYMGYGDHRGGGRFSGRLTIGLVAAGSIAKKIIQPMTVSATLTEAGGSTDIEKAVNQAVASGDSIGGIISCRVTGVPVGLGEPFFHSVESLLSQMVFSIPAIKGIEFGSGFEAARQKGSEHNDPFIDTSGKTATNHAGGINGGITNGNDIGFRVVVKPTSSIGLSQYTMNMKSGKMTDLKITGRHDACIALRVPPVIEAATAIVLADLLMRQETMRAFTK